MYCKKLKNHMDRGLIICLFSLIGIAIPHISQAQDDTVLVKRIDKKTILEFKKRDGKLIKEINVDDSTPYPKEFNNGNSRVAHVMRKAVPSIVVKSGVAVTYRAIAFTEHSEQLQEAGETTVVVYNRSGDELFREKLPLDNAGEPLLSPNGKYVGVWYGGLVPDQETRKIGFTIFDIHKKVKLLEISTVDCNGWVSDDMFIFKVSEGTVDHRKNTYYAFDTRSGSLYSKSYVMPELRLLKRFENAGAVLALSKGSERIEKYETHFIKVK
jgi:hypothetical protein